MRRPIASLLLGWMLVASPALANPSQDISVLVSATVQTSPPRIVLQWPSRATTGYSVYRKGVGDASWGAAVATLNSDATGWTDASVALGTRYMYRVTQGSAYGIIVAGIEVPMEDARGALLLLVDATMATPLATELERLEMDLVGDGWQVIRHDVARANWDDAGWKDAVVATRAVVVAAHAANPGTLRSVFVFGHVPVPYSGSLMADGHPEHLGAWGTDAYYGDVDGVWTDSTVTVTSGTEPRNHNIPGDGKFDQSSLPSDVELEVGRVDLHSLSWTGGITETELLRQYLNKDHNYRHAAFTLQRRAFTQERFNTSSYGAPAWRAYSGHFGASQIVGPTNPWWEYPAGSGVYPEDFFTVLKDNDYLCSYLNGPGWYGGIVGGPMGSDWASAVNDPQTVFTLQFGSYFCDWDWNDSFLRYPLASKSYTLTCGWAGFHDWHQWHMPLGETIGFCMKETSNATGETYLALMGDPTLRLHAVAPPTALSATAGTLSVDLSWTASVDPSVVGYHAYWSDARAGPYVPLTSSPVAATTYTAATAFSGTNYYMVRAVKLETTASGTYYNPSQGVFADADVFIGGTNVAPVAVDATVGAVFGLPVAFTLEATDADGDALTYAVSAEPALGTRAGTLPIVVYTATSVTGNDTLSFTASDGALVSAPATVTIRILAADDDEDLDGLTNGEEAVHGLDMLSEDTDGDGVSDWDEVNAPPASGGPSVLSCAGDPANASAPSGAAVCLVAFLLLMAARTRRVAERQETPASM